MKMIKYIILFCAILFLIVGNVNAEISKNTVYVKGYNQLGLSCEEYGIFDETAIGFDNFYIYDEGFFKVTLDLNDKGDEIGTQIIRISNKKLSYKEIYIKGKHDFYFLHDGSFIYYDNGKIRHYGSKLLESSGTKFEASLLGKPFESMFANISNVYVYETKKAYENEVDKKYLIELQDGSFFVLTKNTNTKFTDTEKLLAIYPDILEKKQPLHTTEYIDDVELKNGKGYIYNFGGVKDIHHVVKKGNDIFYLGSDTSAHSSGEYFLYKNDEKSTNTYRIDSIGGGGIFYRKDLDVLGIYSWPTAFHFCYQKGAYESSIDIDNKTYLFHEHANYEIIGEYGNQYVQIGDKKYGPYQTVTYVVFSPNYNSFAYIDQRGAGKNTLYVNGKKVYESNNPQDGSIYRLQFDAQGEHIYYAQPYAQGGIKLFKDEKLYKQIPEKKYRVNGILYERNSLEYLKVGENGLSYKIEKSELLEEKHCYGNSNEEGEFVEERCEKIPGALWGKKIYQVVENGQIVQDFPMPDKEETGTYQEPKGKIYKELILSKNALEQTVSGKKQVTQIDEIISKLSLESCEKVIQRMERIDITTSKYKNILQYIDAKIKLKVWYNS